MKKTYINPQIECVKVAAPNLLSMSGGASGGSASIYTSGGQVNAGDALGHGNDGDDW